MFLEKNTNIVKHVTICPSRPSNHSHTCAHTWHLDIYVISCFVVLPLNLWCGQVVEYLFLYGGTVSLPELHNLKVVFGVHVLMSMRACSGHNHLSFSSFCPHTRSQMLHHQPPKRRNLISDSKVPLSKIQCAPESGKLKGTLVLRPEV